MPFLALSIKSNLREVENSLDGLARQQLPFAASQAVNRLARQAIEDLKTEMKKVFDRPTPYALNAFYWTKATKRSLAAEIRAKDGFGKGTPAWKFLGPEVFGGTRRMKRFERALEAHGLGGFTVPGRGARLNQYGNISQGQIEQILSALGVEPVGSNRTARSARRKGRKLETYFIAHAKSDGSLLGIYKIVGSGHVEPVLVFTRRALSYSERFPFRETVRASFSRNRDRMFSEALADAIATAK